MKKLAFLLFLPFVLLVFQNCLDVNGRFKDRISTNPGFSEFISAHTDGIISKESTIKVRLANPLTKEWMNKGLPSGLFSFEPSLKGTAIIVDEQTIEFVPNESMKAGTEYLVTFFLEKLNEVPNDFKKYNFLIATIEPSFEYEIYGFKANDANTNSTNIYGVVKTSDLTDTSNAFNLVYATQKGKDLKIKYFYRAQKNEFNFLIQNVKRDVGDEQVKLVINGKAIESDKKEEVDILVPSSNTFDVTNVKVMQAPEQYVSVWFTDALQEDQDFSAFVNLVNVSGVSFKADKNELKIFLPFAQANKRELFISSGLKNANGKKLGKDIINNLVFEQTKPAIRSLGEGTIIPSLGKASFPFEAVNLSAVDVKIIQIFEKNIPQFLQVNSLNTSLEIKRVGRPVYFKTIQLDGKGVFSPQNWTRYDIDLSSIVQKELGAIYQVELSFKQEYSTYACTDNSSISSNKQMKNLQDEKKENFDDFDVPEQSYWDYYYENDYEYVEGYQWNERDNPCHLSYYGKSTRLKKNLLISDLGIMAKSTPNGNLLVVCNDIVTAKPMGSVEIGIYNFQGVKMTGGSTNDDGFWEANLDSKPFLVIADYKKQKGYLKLDDGASLSLSNFDVSGNTLQKGLKGFIYAERGVWRPGDSIYLSFMLDDKESAVPKGLPVILNLKDPDGRIDKRIVRTQNVGGIYTFTTSTDISAPTGTWSAEVQVGGASFNKPLKIETVKPNRLKINLDFGKDKLTSEDKNLEANLSVKWLHGAPVSNLKTEFEAFLVPAILEFPKWKDYSFNDPAANFSSQYISLADGRLDKNGDLKIKTKIETKEDAPALVDFIVKGKVYEEGGDFSVDRFKMPYYPYSEYVGIKLPKGDKARNMLLTDTTHYLDIISVDANGNLKGDGDIEVELYKVQWRWWWDNSSGNSNYVGKESNNLISSGLVKCVNGKGKYPFRVDYPEWGRFYIQAKNVKTGHISGTYLYLDWPGWAGAGERPQLGGNTMLNFSLQKDSYQVGEELVAEIPGSEGSMALVTIENGSRIISKQWVKADNGINIFKTKVTAEMSPNIFVSVALIQSAAKTENDRPLRLYGISPVTIINKESKLEPVLAMANEFAPEKNASVTVSEKNGRKMSYTLAIVDEGLLDLTHFKVPDPFTHFNSKQSLGTKTWDVYSDILLVSKNSDRLLSIGGDEALNAKEGAKSNRFKPVVTVLGPFTLEAGSKTTHNFTMPRYVGSVKVMLVAVNEGAYGNAEKAVPVRESLMILATVPRVVGPGESIRIPTNIFVSDANMKNVNVTIQCNSLFSIVGSASQTISVDKIGEKMAYFELKVNEKIGNGKIEVIAASGSKQAKYSVEMEVRSPNPAQSVVYESLIPAGKEWSVNAKSFGIAGTNKAVLEASIMPSINLEYRLGYLLNYPHGCLEQTVSQAFPQLFVHKMVDDADKKIAAKAEANVKAAITKLKNFQQSSGGFDYWAGSGYENAWATTYAGHFMGEAKKAGYNIPSEMFSRWKRHQSERARSWRREKSQQNDDLTQAYRLYSLAVSGAPEMGAMNRLRETENLQAESRWMLASAYALSGQTQAAKSLINNLPVQVKPYTEMSNTFGSETRDEAIVLETLILMGDEIRGFDLLKKIAQKLSNKDYYMNTQSTAFCLIAVSKYVDKMYKGGDLSLALNVNGKQLFEGNTNKAIATKTIDIEKNQGAYKVINKGKSPLFVRIVLSGEPKSGNEIATANNINLSTNYTDMKGNPIDPTKLETGTNFMMKMRVINKGLLGNMKELALTAMIPSGWEISNTRMDGVEDFYNKGNFIYQDIRDDRVLQYFNLNANESKTFTILLTAAYQGNYYLPAVKAESMYDNNIQAIVPGKWVSVFKPTVN